MKRYILALLLSAFVFITVHDFVLNMIDSDTQQELLLLENDELSANGICDTSKVHHHLHESLLGFEMRIYDISNETVCGSDVISYIPNIIAAFLPQNLYRPPIA